MHQRSDVSVTHIKIHVCLFHAQIHKHCRLTPSSTRAHFLSKTICFVTYPCGSTKQPRGLTRMFWILLCSLRHREGGATSNSCLQAPLGASYWFSSLYVPPSLRAWIMALMRVAKHLAEIAACKTKSKHGENDASFVSVFFLLLPNEQMASVVYRGIISFQKPADTVA